ncbi:hypothetical protein ACTXT7_005965 [Hymenolepis weldensis]
MTISKLIGSLSHTYITTLLIKKFMGDTTIFMSQPDLNDSVSTSENPVPFSRGYQYPSLRLFIPVRNDTGPVIFDKSIFASFKQQHMPHRSKHTRVMHLLLRCPLVAFVPYLSYPLEPSLWLDQYILAWPALGLLL